LKYLEGIKYLKTPTTFCAVSWGALPWMLQFLPDYVSYLKLGMDFGGADICLDI
jgi:hypothetical protein